MFSFYARGANFVSKCRQKNKLYCEIIKIRGSMKKTLEILRTEITDTNKSLHRVLHSSLQLKYGKVYEVATFSTEKSRKFPFETYTV